MRLSLVSMPTLRSASSGNRAGSHPHQSTTTMRRHTLPLLVGAVAAFAVACSDSVAPTRSATGFSATASPAFSKNNDNSDRQLIGTLELSPHGGRYHLGDFDIVIPQGAVCEPATTKYGARHWNEDCSPARRMVAVEARTFGRAPCSCMAVSKACKDTSRKSQVTQEKADKKAACARALLKNECGQPTPPECSGMGAP